MLCIKKMKITKNIRLGELEMLAITILCSVFILSGEVVSRVEGLVFLAIFAIYFYIWYKKEKKRRNVEMKKKNMKSKRPSKKDVFFVCLGGVFVIFGAHLVVGSAAKIAEILGITHTFIGMTAVAVGTSLPELFTTIAAVRKHYYEILVGDIVGSNIVNLLLALGGAAVVRPIAVDFCGTVSTINMVLITAIFSLMTLHRKYTRWEGAVLLALYFTFMYVAYMTGIQV